MVAPTQRHRELVTDLAPESRGLREAQVVSVGGASPTDETGLLGNVPDVIAVANAARLRQAQPALIDSFFSCPKRPSWTRCCWRGLKFPRHFRLVCSGHRKCHDFCVEGFLDAQGIGCRQLILLGESALRPMRRFVSVCKCTDFAEKSIAQCGRRLRAQRWLCGI